MKLLRFPERIAEWMRTGKTTVPIGIDIHLTDKCPHKCPHCNAKFSTGHTLDSEFAMTILTEFARLGGKAVNVLGGEPLAHPECVEIVEHAKSEGLSVGLMTNLYRLTDDMARRLTQACTWIRVSLDAGTPETYAKMHGVKAGEFRTVLQRIVLLTAQPGDCTISVGILTSKANIGDILQATQAARDAGAEYVQIRPINQDRAACMGELEVAEALSTEGFKVSVAWPKYKRLERSVSCHGCHFWTLVMADGRMRVCCETRTENAIYADLNEMNFRDGWQFAKDAIAKIDMSKCPFGCHLLPYNVFLDSIATPLKHEAHL